VRNRSAQDPFELYQSRDKFNCKSQKMLNRRDLDKSRITLKIRRASALGGSTPPPGTNPQDRAGRGSQTHWQLHK